MFKSLLRSQGIEWMDFDVQTSSGPAIVHTVLHASSTHVSSNMGRWGYRAVSFNSG